MGGSPTQFPHNTGPDGKTGEVVDEELDLKAGRVGWGRGGAGLGSLCRAVTYVQVIGERHKEGLVPRGWSPQPGGLR